METPINVVVLAAGLGTRMKSKKAKVLHRAGGLALIEHAVRTALDVAPPERVFVVTGYQADEVRAVLAPYGVGIIHQAEQKGTGQALLCCREALEGREGLLIVFYGDGPLLSAATLRRLAEEQRGSGAAATLITTRLEDPTGYGRILLDSGNRVSAIVEQKSATTEQLAIREINSGIYCFRAEALWKHIGEIRPDNSAGEYYLTDMVEIFRRAGHAVDAMSVEDSRELLGINTRVELAQVDAVFRQRKNVELMLAGVTIEKPDTVTIDCDVAIGRDTVVEPCARILGRTRIGEDCRIGSAAVIEDCRLGNRVQVAPYTCMIDSQLDDDAQAGPFTRLRPGAHIEAGAHTGNFVELKKTRLGKGSKAMHLAYLGDSEIGEGVNVGAGTITCNYDGIQKHQTVIGDRAFVGSNSTLVAPVEIGAGSYIAAGSVVTKDVPEDSLAVARSHQIVKDGWAKRRREKAQADSASGDDS